MVYVFVWLCVCMKSLKNKHEHVNLTSIKMQFFLIHLEFQVHFTGYIKYYFMLVLLLVFFTLSFYFVIVCHFLKVYMGWNNIEGIHICAGITQ